MLRSFIASMLMFAAIVAFSQNSEKNQLSKRRTVFAIQQYSEQVFKVTYTPPTYKKSELVSDAVVLKPLIATGKRLLPLKGGDKISNKATLLGSFSEGELQGFSFALEPGEEIYGGGSRAVSLNRRGYRLSLYNNPWYGYGEGADALNYSVPFFISSKGYGLFFDNPSIGVADIGKTKTEELNVAFTSGELNVFVITGNSVADVLTNYHKLTGTQPLPPKWAMGNFMSRFGYTSRQQVEEIYGKMKAEEIPVDAVIFDLFWFGDSIKGTLGNLDWVNKQKWPDAKGMLTNFRKDGVNPILVTEPFVVKTSQNYTASKPYHAVDKNGKPFVLTDFYFGHGGLLDLFRKDAQDWFWKKHKAQMNKGVEAWWGDLGEPEKHPDGLYHNLKDLGFSRLFSNRDVHNIYGHTWTKFLYNKYAQHYPNKRLFSLNRSGFAGTQRFSIFPWSGDVSRSWTGFRAQLPVMLGMSMSGIPYMHADAGGFAGGEGDKELYVRWIQFAAFTPVFRPHGTALYEVDKNAFSFPSEAALIDTPYREIAKKYINLRYKLMPYNYTLAYKQAAKGVPLVAPVHYYYPGDTSQSQFMWGSDIMVAPVTRKGVEEMVVNNPNKDWCAFDVLSNTYNALLLVDDTMRFSTPLDYMPVLVKAGSFIPMINREKFHNISDTKTDSLVLHYYYSPKGGTGILYDDDGQSKNALQAGKYELISFKAGPATTLGQRIIIRSVHNGGFKGRPSVRNIKFVLHGYRGAGIDVKSNSRYDSLQISQAEGNTEVISFDYKGKAVQLFLKGKKRG